VRRIRRHKCGPADFGPVALAAQLCYLTAPSAVRSKGGLPGECVAFACGRLSSAVEQRFCKPKVGSSILSAGTSKNPLFFWLSSFAVLDADRGTAANCGAHRNRNRITCSLLVHARRGPAGHHPDAASPVTTRSPGERNLGRLRPPRSFVMHHFYLAVTFIGVAVLVFVFLIALQSVIG
jgi:hypothetical protein